MWDQNSVSVSGTENKVQFQYRFRSRFFFSETETLFFQIFLIFSHFLGEYKFYKLENNLKCLEENLVLGALLWWKRIPHAIGHPKYHWMISEIFDGKINLLLPEYTALSITYGCYLALDSSFEVSPPFESVMHSAHLLLE